VVKNRINKGTGCFSDIAAHLRNEIAMIPKTMVLLSLYSAHIYQSLPKTLISVLNAYLTKEAKRQVKCRKE
jgi:hypothetical protein